MTMLINGQTKIAALLKHHPDALEAIVSLSPDFKKLKNPVLRTLMAGRTSIAMASKIGGCRPEDFFRVLAPLGFETDGSPVTAQEKPVRNNAAKPVYLQEISTEQLVHFDVRTVLAEGKDPLKQIQHKVAALLPGQALVIINNFEPVPLIKLLERQGFRTHVDFVDADTIETYFYKTADSGETAEAGEGTGSTAEQEAGRIDPDEWEALLARYRDKLKAIDVRHLEMPMPMMTILENLEVLPEGQALYVQHKRIPVFLLTELKERDFDYRIREVRDGEVYLLIFKNE